MRIVSLLPSATEIAYALGLGDHVVGVTHECDYPTQVRDTNVVTRSMLDHTQASSAEIDALVSSQRREQLSIYHLEADLLGELQPDLILTQALCDVCAVSYTTVRQVVRDLGGAPRVLSLEPSDLDGILETISTVGQATDRLAEATTLVTGLRQRITKVRQRAALAPYRPRVVCLEWLDPPFSPGHWLPEMIDLAGGQAVLGQAGQPSARTTWDDVIASKPDIIIAAPCGFDLDQASAEANALLPTRQGWETLPAVQAGRVYAVNANAYYSRPGPRVIDGLELLASLIHPDLFAGWGPPDAAWKACAKHS